VIEIFTYPIHRKVSIEKYPSKSGELQVSQAHSWTFSKRPVKVMDGLKVVLSGLTMGSQRQDSPNFPLQFLLQNLVGSSISFSKAARDEMLSKYAVQAHRALRQSDLMLHLIVLQVDPLFK